MYILYKNVMFKIIINLFISSNKYMEATNNEKNHIVQSI